MILYIKYSILANFAKWRENYPSFIKAWGGSMKRFSLLFLCLAVASAASFAANPPKGPVTLRFSWWGGEDRHKATLKAIDIYQRRNPDVKIEAEYGGFDGYYQKLVTQLAGGTAADIVQIDQPWLFELSSKGDIFYPLDKDPSIDLSGFNSTFLKSYCSYGNKICGLPTGINGECLLVDTKLLQKSGALTSPKWTWETILGEGKKVNAANRSAYFFALDPQQVRFFFERYMAQVAGGLVGDDKRILFTEKQAADAFAYFKKLLDQKVIAPFPETILYNRKVQENPDWINGNMAVAWTWTSNLIQTKAGKSGLEIAELPIMDKAVDTGVITRPSQVMAVNAASANRDEAVKFLNFFFNEPEALEALGSSRGVPPTELGRKLLTSKGLLDPQVSAGTDWSLSKMGKPQSVWQINSEVAQVLDDLIEKFGFGKLTPAQAAKELMSSLKSKLATL
jgi:oligogalacturonide transport system substrate-binding protein